MKTLLATGSICLCLFSNGLLAQTLPSEKEQAISEFLHAANAGHVIENSKRYMHDTIGRMPREMNMLGEHRDFARSYMVKMTRLVETEVSWEKAEPKLAELYDRLFTTEELKEITAFYQTEVGKKLIARTPQLVNESMQIAQELMETTTPKLQALQQEMIKEIKAYEANKKQSEPAPAPEKN